MPSEQPIPSPMPMASASGGSALGALGRCIVCLVGYLKPTGKDIGHATRLWQCQSCRTLQRYPLPPRLQSESSRRIELSSDPRRFLVEEFQRLSAGQTWTLDTLNARAMSSTIDRAEGPTVVMTAEALKELCVATDFEVLEVASYGAPRFDLSMPSLGWFDLFDWFSNLHRQLKAIDQNTPMGVPMDLEAATRSSNLDKGLRVLNALFERYRVWQGRGDRLRLVLRRPTETVYACPVCQRRLVGSRPAVFCATCATGRQEDALVARAQYVLRDECQRPALRRLREPSWIYWLKFVERRGWVGRLLDYGCADGALMTLAQSRGWDVWGVETRTDLVSSASTAVRYRILTDATWSEHFMANSCEAAIAWDLLDSVDNPTVALSELHRALDRNGSLLLRVPNGLLYPTRQVGIYKRVAKRQAIPLYRRWVFTPSAIRQLLSDAGFDRIEIHSGPPYQEGIDPLGNSWICRILSVLSFGRWFTGASLVVLARKRVQGNADAGRRRRVLNVVTQLDDSLIAEDALLSALSLAYNRFSVEIFTATRSRPHPLVEKILKQKGLRSRSLSTFRAGTGLWGCLPAIFEMRRTLRRGGYDVVHTHGRQAGWIGRLGALLSGQRGITLVHSTDSSETGHWLEKKLDRWLAQRTASLIGQTPFEVNAQVSRGVGRFDQWVVIPKVSLEKEFSTEPVPLRKALLQTKNFVDDFIQYRTEAMAPVLEKLYLGRE